MPRGRSAARRPIREGAGRLALPMSVAKQRIVVITGDHGAPDPTKPAGRYLQEDLAYHEAMREAFSGIDGFAFEFWTDHTDLFDRLRAEGPELVVNFCDTGVRNVAVHELHLPAMLELLGIPYTGAPPAAIAICYDKQIVRLLARDLGVDVPREHFLGAEGRDFALEAQLPLLLKPNQADGSLGITKDAVVRSLEEARHYLGWLRDSLPGRDVLAQEFLSGPEYGIALIGNPETGLEALPALQVDYSGLPEGLSPILSYESKTMPDSPYATEIRYRRASLPAEDEARLVAWSRLLFSRLGLRDYGRFDFRTAADGRICLMEVNPNPAWDPEAKLAFMANFAGIDYRGMLGRLLDAARQRIALTP